VPELVLEMEMVLESVLEPVPEPVLEPVLEPVPEPVLVPELELLVERRRQQQGRRLTPERVIQILKLFSLSSTS
jgi:hypothetical protein